MRYVLLSVLMVLAFSPAALACSCALSDPCGAFSGAKAVFIGKMLSGTEKHIERGENGKNYTIESGRVTFSVKESFNGKLPAKIALQIDSMEGTSCGTYGLRRGVEYLVYAYESKNEPGTLYTGVCTRTTRIDRPEAKEDLDFLRHLPPKGSGGKLTGFYRADIKNGDGTIPLSGIKVKLTGKDNKELTVTTDAEGRFELAKLKAGKYRVEAELPENFTADETVQEIEIIDRGCAWAGLEAEMTGKVAGRVTDINGKPYNSSFLNLVPVLASGKFFENISGGSDEENTGFLIEGVPPGEYYLFTELQHRQYSNSRKYYYPGTYNSDEAQKIIIGLGGSVEGINFVLPPEFLVRTIKGQVFWPDGKPAEYTEVALLCPRSEKEDGYAVEFGPTATETDGQGNFEIQGFAGEIYWLSAVGQKGIPGGKKFYTKHSPLKKIIVKDDISGLKIVLTESDAGVCGDN